jgi:hypothetical protein
MNKLITMSWTILSFLAGSIFGAVSFIAYAIWDVSKNVSGGTENDDTTRTIKRI